MDPGYRTPLIDFFRRGDAARDARLLAAQGVLPTTPHEQLALLVLLADDPDGEIASTADATLRALPAAALQAFLAQDDVPAEMRTFFAERARSPVELVSNDAAATADSQGDDDNDEDDDDEPDTQDATPTVMANLPIKKKIKLASKGTREQRAQLIRDPNKLVSSAVLTSPKLTDAEVESFTKMGNVTEEVLRVIGTNRSWLKNYGVVLGLVKNPKTPPAISMQMMQRLTERDMKMLAVDRNVPEALRLAARKFIVKGLK
jgi:hypothetical protein